MPFLESAYETRAAGHGAGSRTNPTLLKQAEEHNTMLLGSFAPCTQKKQPSVPKQVNIRHLKRSTFVHHFCKGNVWPACVGDTSELHRISPTPGHLDSQQQDALSLNIHAYVNKLSSWSGNMRWSYDLYSADSDPLRRQPTYVCSFYSLGDIKPGANPPARHPGGCFTGHIERSDPRRVHQLCSQALHVSQDLVAYSIRLCVGGTGDASKVSGQTFLNKTCLSVFVARS